MLDALKTLFENDVVSAEVRQEIEEALVLSRVLFRDRSALRVRQLSRVLAWACLEAFAPESCLILCQRQVRRERKVRRERLNPRR